jgi:YfiH family protein
MMQRLAIDWPDLPAGVGVLSTLRGGGVSAGRYGAGTGGEGGLNLGLHVGDDPIAVEKNRGLLRAHLPSVPAWLAQVHGTRVLDLSSWSQEASAAIQPPEADASIACAPARVCAIMSADCLPVLLADCRGTHVGAAHAGWRGLAKGVIEQTVAAMRAAGADQMTAWLGPAIGPEAFEVGAEVRQAFVHLGPEAGAAFVPVAGIPNKWLANLPRLARLALQSVGVTQVYGGLDCTVADPLRFYSFRRDQITGRMASLIWIK